MPYLNVEMCTMLMKTSFDFLAFDYKFKRMVASKNYVKILRKVLFQNNLITIEAYKFIIH